MTPATISDRFSQPEVIKTIKETVAIGSTDAELAMFLEVCRSTGLNPFLKEIWFVASRIDQKTGKRRPAMIMAARDGYLRVANENPQFDGIETRVERNDKNIPIKAVCTVWRKDRNHPVICEAYFNEYVKSSPIWEQYPSAMISKVAEVLALKRSFAINGVVTEEEIGQGNSEMAITDGKTPAEYYNEGYLAGQHGGWEGSGSTAAARKTGEAIIADLKAGKPYNGPKPPDEKLLEASIDKAKETKTRGFSPKYCQRLNSFGEIKKDIPEAEYYRCLGEAGYSHANEFPDTAKGVQAMDICLADMREIRDMPEVK